MDRLRASRARIAAMAHDQRREIERRLHDGIQQDLVALAVHLQLAEAAAVSDPAALRGLLGAMRRDVHEAIEGVRSLARGVYPPLLTDLGLAAALRGLALGANLPVDTEVPTGRFPADLQPPVHFSFLQPLHALSPHRSTP